MARPHPPALQSATETSMFCRSCWFLAAVCLTASASVAQPPGQATPANVVVAEVQQLKLPVGQTFVGSLVPLRTSTVGSRIEGKVEEFFVNEGDAVSRLDPLVQLETDEMEIQLDVAEAELEIRRQQALELKKVLPLQITQADARLKTAQALLKLAQMRWQRAKSLFESNTVSKDNLQEAESILTAARQKTIENESALLEISGSEHEKYAAADAQVLALKGAVRRLTYDIQQHTIRAPFDGLVTKEHTEVGQWMAKGDPVVELVEIQPIEVEVHVLEKYASQLRLDTEAPVLIGALSGQQKLRMGRVTVIVPQADLRSRTFPVKVRLDNPPAPGGRLLKPGMLARVTLPVGNRQPVLVVPKDALILGGSSLAVCVVDPVPQGMKPAKQVPGAAKPDGIARRVAVELGAAYKDLIEVRGLLQAGDRVVVEGNERLFTGQPVTIVTQRKRITQPPAAAATK